ncbi:MAG: mechanosensitive ion channel family protein [Spirochaetaceae bacterium]|jgi:small-conductance mechanosensitive channel|nr:mechanosensitive ion channel family protein [Spirochaetaceae bacterium]
MIIKEILNITFWGNSLEEYLIAAGIFLAGILIVFIFRKIFQKRIEKQTLSTKTRADDLLFMNMSKSIFPIMYLGTFYIATKYLNLSQTTSSILQSGGIIIITFLVVRTIFIGIRLGLQYYLRHSQNGEQKELQLKGIQTLLNLIIWVIALVFVLDNLGVKITAVVAGLGIGGVAVALAAQTILGDLFNYFVIFFDKPFEIGDFIIIGDKLGVVEKIGIKTTRIRALGGEQLVFSNTDLTDSRVHNYKKMEKRRVVFKLSVIYQTPFEKLKEIKQIVREIIQNQGDVVFDRGHFATYGDFSLIFEFVYYLNGSDYNKYMDTQEAINLAIFEAFEREEISFAYPTQTVYMNQN